VSPDRGHEQTSYLARAFDNRYPWVRTYSAWNEVNQVSQPTSYVLDASNRHSYLRSHLARYRVGLSAQGRRSASLPHVASAPTAAPDALLATSRPEDALENAQRDMEQVLATF
jgi:hypothetical protein